MLDKLKQHPWLYGGVAAIAIIVVIYYSESGGGSTASSDPSAALDAQTTAAEQLQAQQLSVQGALQQTQLQAGAQAESDATGLQEYTIQQQTASNANSLAAQVAELQATLSSNDTQVGDSLQAGVDNASIAAQVSEAQIASNTTIQSTQTVANALVQESNNSATVQEAALATQFGENQQNVELESQAIQAANSSWF